MAHREFYDFDFVGFAYSYTFLSPRYLPYLELSTFVVEDTLIVKPKLSIKADTMLTFGRHCHKPCSSHIGFYVEYMPPAEHPGAPYRLEPALFESS